MVGSIDLVMMRLRYGREYLEYGREYRLSYDEIKIHNN